MYLIWSISLFLYLLFIWYWTFKGFNSNLDYLNSPSSLLYVIIRLLIIYFAIETLTPDERNDFKSHFLNVSKRFYLIIIALWSYELLLYPLTGHFDLSPRMFLYLINLPVSLILFFINNEKVQIVLTILVLVIQIIANIFVVTIL